MTALARKIMADVRAHRAAEPRYVVDTNENPSGNIYGEFHIYGPESPVISTAHLLVSQTPPRVNFRHGPSMIGSFYVPAVLGLNVLPHVLADRLEDFPNARFVGCHYGVDGKRAWRLYFRTLIDAEWIGNAIHGRTMGRNVWFYADAKDRIQPS